MKAENWVTVIAVVLGLIGTIVSGVIGYQSGSNAVNKDYVSLAITTLDKKDASPELRKWAVDVLSQLSPVAFGDKLKKELVNGTPFIISGVTPTVKIPPGLDKQCPDVMKGTGKVVGRAIAVKVLNEYEKCRIRYELMLEYLSKMNSILEEGNAERRRQYEAVTGRRYPERDQKQAVVSPDKK